MNTRRIFTLRVLLFLVLSIATFVLAEIAAFAFLYFESGHTDSKVRIQSSLQAYAGDPASSESVRATDLSPRHMRQHILHPYLGFVRNPEVTQHRFNGAVVREPVNSYGFWGPDPVSPGAGDNYIIAILGGSVAAEMYLYSRDTLARALKADGLYGDKPVKFVSLALGGMKQPQQLIALAYVLAQGARFDAVVNLDGFNEIVLPVAENTRFGVNPVFPRNWRAYASKSIGPGTAMLTGRISVARDELLHWTRRLNNSVLRESYAALAVWQQYHLRTTAEIRQYEDQLRKQLSRRRELTVQESGPPFDIGRNNDRIEQMTGIWARSSQALWALCKQWGIDYLHVLQPNQYLAGSHQLTQWEKRNAISAPDHPYRRNAEKGYPALVAAGGILEASGLPFADLTGIFGTEPRTVYKDNCCHYNQLGSEILAKEIAAAMKRRAFSRSGS